MLKNHIVHAGVLFSPAAAACMNANYSFGARVGCGLR